MTWERERLSHGTGYICTYVVDICGVPHLVIGLLIRGNRVCLRMHHLGAVEMSVPHLGGHCRWAQPWEGSIWRRVDQLSQRVLGEELYGPTFSSAERKKVLSGASGWGTQWDGTVESLAEGCVGNLRVCTGAQSLRSLGLYHRLTQVTLLVASLVIFSSQKCLLKPAKGLSLHQELSAAMIASLVVVMDTKRGGPKDNLQRTLPKEFQSSVGRLSKEMAESAQRPGSQGAEPKRCSCGFWG